MSWFIAHVIESARFDDGNQDVFPVFENMVLIEGSEETDLDAKAIAIASTLYGGQPVTYDGRAATYEIVGIRKIIRCVGEHLGDGVEVTFTRLTVSSEAELQALANGDEVTVHYDDE